MKALSTAIQACTLACALTLTGCATTRIVDSEVHSHSTLAAMPQPATYRIERLPSQQLPSPWRAMIEQQTTEALARVGMQRDDVGGAMRLEIDAQARSHRPHWPHYGSWHLGWSYGPWGWSPAWYYGYDWYERPPLLHLRQIRLVLRDAQGKPVYESSARYENTWVLREEAMFQLLLASALDGFPTPPQGLRHVRHEIPR